MTYSPKLKHRVSFWERYGLNICMIISFLIVWAIYSIEISWGISYLYNVPLNIQLRFADNFFDLIIMAIGWYFLSGLLYWSIGEILHLIPLHAKARNILR